MRGACSEARTISDPSTPTTAGRPTQPLDIQLFDGKLVLRQRLSFGMMNAQIFRGTHVDYGDVVCKIIPIPPDEQEAARMRQYVKDEADCGHRLHNPHVRRLHDDGVFETLPELQFPDGAVYLLFEWVPSTLGGIVNLGLPAPRQVLRLAHALAAGLRAAHESLPPIVHRDLKPQNVLVVDPEDLKTAKLADFGIARMAGGTSVTSVQGWTGTELYMAPEQFESSPTVTPCADIYAFALLLWECLTGVVPLQADGVGKLRELREKPVFPELEVGGAPRPELFNILRWALHPNPGMRPQQVDKLVEGFADAGVRDGLWTKGDADAAAAAMTAPRAIPRVLVPPNRGSDERARGGALELVLPVTVVGVLERITPGVDWTYSLVRRVWSTVAESVGIAEVTRILEAASAREPLRVVREEPSVYTVSPPLVAPAAGAAIDPESRTSAPMPSTPTPVAALKKPTPSVPSPAPAPLVRPSPTLAAIVGDQSMPRFTVANRIWEYIHQHDLQDGTNRSGIIADEKLQLVFGGRKSVTVQEMITLVNRHLRDV